MSAPVRFEEVCAFGGETRVITRERLYRYDDADFDAAMHEEPVAPPPDDEEIVIDPYEESRYAPPVPETPEAQAQFRTDISSSTMKSIVASKRLNEPSTNIAPSIFAKNLRKAAILRAMTDSIGEHSIFSVDYASHVPKQYIREFFSSVEVTSVRSVLVPSLMIRKASARVHLEEEHWRRVMADVGATFRCAETIVYDGHLRTLVPLPPAENGWYTHDILECEHAHYESQTTKMRILTFQIETTAAATTIDGHVVDARRESDNGYYVKLVLHLVTADSSNELHNVLCFRTFHFSRHR